MKTNEKIIIWKDRKIITGIIIVVVSFLMGWVGKGLLIVKFYEPVYAITGISLEVASWILLFFGIFLVGWETIRLIQHKVHHHIRKTVKTTHHSAKELTRKSINYSKDFHKRSMAKISKTSREIAQKMR